MKKSYIAIASLLIFSICMLAISGVMAATVLPTDHITKLEAKGVGRAQLTSENGVHPIRGTLTIDFKFSDPTIQYHSNKLFEMIEIKSATDPTDRYIWQVDTNGVTCEQTNKGLVTYITAHFIGCPWHSDDQLGSITVEYQHGSPVIRVYGDSFNFVGNIQLIA